ncbi:BLUF domain-containing protein [Congregibacter variabilis]|uniref:BLUF domain-containing protein n=1 Tax=Congregibacter variabilis TaxID=3081200 RepID=A0ABZ0HYU2_9GAMM|nr:BLUF domain-containing protein [Congregibacter sp. IMCC43200]
MFDEPGFPREADLGYSAIALETFVYCSRASEGVGDVEVDRLIEFSQRRNAARGVTGMLVYGNGVFFQWVEGPPNEVRNLIASLHGDSRHHDIVELDRSVDKRERLYPGWEMERVEAEDIRAVLLDALESAQDQNNVAALKRTLEHLDSAPLASLGIS